jgi:hypothetical protein
LVFADLCFFNFLTSLTIFFRLGEAADCFPSRICEVGERKEFVMEITADIGDRKKNFKHPALMPISEV